MFFNPARQVRGLNWSLILPSAARYSLDKQLSDRHYLNTAIKTPFTGREQAFRLRGTFSEVLSRSVCCVFDVGESPAESHEVKNVIHISLGNFRLHVLKSFRTYIPRAIIRLKFINCQKDSTDVQVNRFFFTQWDLFTIVYLIVLG